MKTCPNSSIEVLQRKHNISSLGERIYRSVNGKSISGNMPDFIDALTTLLYDTFKQMMRALAINVSRELTSSIFQ